MKPAIIRFLGAFGKAPSLRDALEYEFERKDEVAATSGGEITHVGVGLWMKRSGIIRKNRGDVWSIRLPNGKLRATRSPVKTHQEFWMRGGRRYINGVVITRQISSKAFETVRHVCAENGIDMFVMDCNGKFKPVTTY